MAYQLSTQQLAVLDWVKNGQGSLNLIARAGTGKTSTLMEVAKAITGTGFMGSYNKAIADEFKERLAAQGTRNVVGATLHSAGIGAWRKLNPRVQVDGQKVRGIAKRVAGYDNKLVRVICDTVSMGKQAVLGVKGQASFKSAEAWRGIIEYYDMADELPAGVGVDKLIEYAMKVYRVSLEECEDSVDFDDMLLAPLYYEAPFTKYDWVLIDEAQDTNEARRLLSFAMMHEKSRLIAVGDPRQAIYGFAGANSNSMDLIKQTLGSSELPLSVTYRCPKAVVDMAQLFVPDIQAHDSNPEGEVGTINHRQLWEEDFKPSDVILCRNTRPLAGIASRLRSKGVACVVEGMSGKGLATLAGKWGEDVGIEAFLEYLDQYQSEEAARWTAKQKMEKVQFIEDRCDTLRDLCQGLGRGATTANLISRIEMLFDSTGVRNVLKLCTIHRSKGREWDRVFLIGRNRYMPSPYAEQEWEKQQEDNLAYVALTRSKRCLVEVEVPFKRRDEQEWWEA